MKINPNDLTAILGMIERGEISPQDAYQLIGKLEQNKQQADGFQSVVLTRPGHTKDIALHPLSPSEPEEGELQILVKAFSLNFGDLLCVKGLYPTMPAYPFTPGFEVSGVVMKTGSNVSHVNPGDEVIGLMGDSMGGQSSVVTIPEQLVVKKPVNVSHEEACAFPIVFTTMYHVFETAKVQKGDKLLIQTAAGGVGLIAVQLAQLIGAECYATAGSQEKLDYLKNIGVKHLINYRQEDFAGKIQELTEGKGVDVVINTLAGDAIQKGINSLAPGGRYMEIAMVGLKSAEKFDLSNLVDNQTFHSVDLRRLVSKQPELIQKYLGVMSNVLADGAIKATVGKVFNMAKINDAYRWLEKRENIGKVVVVPETGVLASELIPSYKPAEASDVKTSNSSSKNFFTNNKEERPILADENSQQENKGDIAIIGISCRVSGAADVDTFWSNLANGHSSIREVPADRWSSEEFYDADPHKLDKTNSKWGGFLKDVDQFDAFFFNMSGKEAEMTDPQQRIFLEESWLALEDAGYANDEISHKKCAVFAGVGNSDYMMHFNNGVEPQSLWGTESSILPARISYFLNLKGPSVTVNTACSSSLVSIHLGCQSILNGDSDMALSGGVFISNTPYFHIAASNAGMLSSDGKCKTFDDRANGFVPGEGCGVVVLKSLEAAKRDGDRIYGVIKGSGINQDGKTNGITAPSTLSQTELELAVYQKAGINPEDISYVEAHGTGTKLGDPIEIEALTNSFRQFTDKKQFCAIGSVKTNIGHTSAAAGVASVIKVLMAFKHRQLPPSLNCTTYNQHIDFPNSPFFVNKELRDWEHQDNKPRIAAISSFGFSGTNAHIVIEEPPNEESWEQDQAKEMKAGYFIPISAKTEKSLKQRVEDLLQWCQNKTEQGENINLTDLSYTLCQRRGHFPLRTAWIVRDLNELQTKLQNFDLLEEAVKSKLSIHREQNRQKKLITEMKNITGTEYVEHLEKLKEFYKQGDVIEWKALFNGVHHKLISLPAYPFDRERYWHQDHEIKLESAKAYLHPLIEVNTSSLKEQRYSTHFTGEEFYLRDHQVAGSHILPATAYIELARAAGELSSEGSVVKLNNLTWINPFILSEEDSANHLHISLYPEQDRVIGFDIYSGDNQKESILHAEGMLSLEKQSAEREIMDMEEFLSPVEIKSRCKAIPNSGSLYEWFSEHDLVYGESFQTIDELYIGNREALALLKLPEIVSYSHEDFMLHPSILDGSLQTMIGTIYGKGEHEGDLYLPFALESLVIFHPVTSSCYAYVTQLEDDPTAYNIYLADQSGKILVQMFQLKVRKHIDQSRTEDTLFYQPSWDLQPLPSESKEPTTSLLGDVIIFDHHEQLYREWIGSQHENLGNSSRVVLVQPGASFKVIDTTRFVLNPEDSEQYQMLLDTLMEKEIQPKFILYKWSYQENLSSYEQLENVLTNGIYSLFHLTRSLMQKQKGIESIRLIYSNTNQGEAHPANVAVSSWLQSLVQENPRFQYKYIELDNQINKKRLWIQEFAALNSQLEAPKHIDHVRYQSGERWALVMRPQKLINQTEREPKGVSFRKKGTYVITGGLGGVGLTVANYLVTKFQAKLVLTGRSAITIEQQSYLHKWEMLGSEVIYHQADISKKEDVNALLAAAKERFGNIHGIIHSAGVLHDGLIINKSLESMKNVFAAKVYGTWWLDEVTRDESLDFFVLFSSLASIFGNLGQSDYGYANGFLDAYVGYRESLRDQGKRHGRTVTLNWPSWQTKGMQLDPFIEEMMTEQGMYPLSKQKGLKALETALLTDRSGQWLVLNGEKNKLQQLLDNNPTTGNNTLPHEVTIDKYKTSENTLFYYQKMQEYLIDILAEETRVPVAKIECQEPLETYGIDSAMIVNLTRVLERDFGKLTKTLFFEYQTIGELAAFFAEQYQNQLTQLFGSNPEKHSESKLQVKVSNKERIKTAEQRRNRFIRESFPLHPSIKRQIDDPVAIIGVSGRYPMADNVDEFWENLKSGKDCITEIPEERWDKERSISESKWGGFINDVDKFDPLFFNISPREAELMDPQERLFLQSVWHTLEDAGYTHTALKKSRTGVFVGVMYGLYQMYGTQNVFNGEGYVPSSSYASVANRVSYYMDWTGPSMAVDTMCSSSLTALHLACKSIQEGEVETAIAGGVNLSIHPYKYHLLSQGSFTSSDGRCRSFGEGGDGYVPGEGVGSILLKPLSKALADGDQVYGVIRGSAINHGGKTNGFTVPDPNAQANVMKETLRKANVEPEQISYIEAHGTGTALGDPIEISGLAKAYSTQLDKRQYCAIGSVKSNIGHAESAAGIAALTKVLLQMKHRKLVPSLHSETLNSNIDFADTPFYVQREIQDWHPSQGVDTKLDKPRLAAISSFGAGGSNAHIIIEDYERRPVEEVVGPYEQIFILSAKDQESLKSYAGNLRDYIRDASPQDFQQIAYTLQVGREQMAERLAIVASDLDELASKLDHFLAGDSRSRGIYNGNLERESVIDVLGRGKMAQEFVKAIIADKETAEIAKLWSVGVEIDWDLFYPAVKPQRISLPGYPFKRERYWVDIQEEPKTVSTKSMPTNERKTVVVQTPASITLSDDGLLKKVVNDLHQTAAYLIKIQPDRLDIHENLGNFGFDSVTLKELSHELSSLYKVDVLPTAFFEQSHIAGIAEYMLKEFREEIRSHYEYDHEEEPNQKVVVEGEPTQSDTSVSRSQLYTNHEPIAIIGMSGMFPQSKDLEEYWSNLVKGEDMISEVPEDRWDWKEFADKAGKLYSSSRWGGFIEDVDKFDPRFFNISPYEAEMMDPQQRLALQTVWKTIEDAGYKASDYSGRNVGLFVGAQFQDYLQLLHDDGQFNAQMGTGNELSILVNRISYLLNFHGPSEPYNTACSSSSVAIHRAVQSIRNGESEVAIAGGVSLILAPYGMISAGQMGILSPDGRCKTLAADANGYVKGEGIGMLMLKPLSKAISDNDHIYSVIKGTAVNHGGKANSLTAPNSEAQANLLTAAYEEAGFDPETINYIELHGTGTELGDPVEIEGIKKAFKQLARKQGKSLTKQAYCGIGSVKTNIGHLEPASGIAGIMKVILAMQNKKLPGILHLNKVNPYVKLENTPFYITDQTRDWKQMTDASGNKIPRRAGVSSFGFGGVNAHIVLEEYEEISAEVETESSNQLFVLSAKNEHQLKEYVKHFIHFIDKQTYRENHSFVSKGSLQAELCDIIAGIINVSSEDLDVFEDFEDYGFGAVQWNRLLTELHVKYGIDIQSVLNVQNDYQSISELTEFLLSLELGGSGNSIAVNKDKQRLFTRLAYTLHLGREEMNTRIATVAKSLSDLATKLQDYVKGIENIDGFYFGKVVSARGLNEQSAGNASEFDRLLQGKDLYALAKRWTEGAQINWKALYDNLTIQRIPLPTYPFAKESYWAPKSKPTAKGAQSEQSLMAMTELELAVTSNNTLGAQSDTAISHKQIIQILKEILAEKLKLDSAELEADVELSVYGVDSMLSSVIMQVVEERFGEQMDASVIVEYPTISSLASYILEEVKPMEIDLTPSPSKPKASKSKYPPELIPINTKGTKQISFWFHGATGYSTVFRNLSKIIGPDYPMYAFQARGTDGKTMPQMFDEMVDHYYNCVRMIQPKGPYFFGGYSFGGLVAMEIARRLKAEGEEILHLVMFDTYPPTDEVNNLFYGTYDFDFLKLFLVNAFLKSDENPELLITNEDIENVPRRLQISYLAKLAKEKSGTIIETDEIYNFIKGGMLVSDYAEEAYAAYRPDPYDVSNVTFFKTTKGFVAEDNPLGLPGVNILDNYDYTTYWVKMVSKELDVFAVECDHNSILEEPVLSEVAPKVLQLLEGYPLKEEPRKSMETESGHNAEILLETFQSMGVFKHEGESYTMQELFAKLELPHVYTSLFHSWIDTLELKGYIGIEDDKIITTNVIKAV
ncbi:SDR family NAD(P)-dependent oxidoreductase [Bacillus atrophaeus]|uniref:SDR family NAD(P)-dependent oxidoreductase n=1 Tax=Bacillus atrophaeus TaxID=1452 RepID=UPI00227F1A46|nr:SDR family NAD(P)-dependent oxidoreductase [Bacillus atrophaeus]MCY9109396.1 SDR family NAD(P)-dependent oxidoreductase [Bacillus atrophaeus]